MEVRIDVAPIRDLMARLKALSVRVDDFQPLWDRLAGIMVEVETDWFETEGHGGWPPLAQSTLREKARYGYPLDPLLRTGALKGSLTTPEAGLVNQARTSLGTFGLKTFSWGTDVVYAHFHQHSQPGGAGLPADYGFHPPERQVIEWPIADTTHAAIEGAMEGFLEDAVREVGLL